MAIGDDFLSNPTSSLFQDKEAAPGATIPVGLTVKNVPDADDFNGIHNALKAIRTYVLEPLEARAVPWENVLVNSGWQLMTLVSYGPKMLADGTGEKPAVSASAYTTTSNTCVFTTADTDDLKIGDLLVASAAAHANLKVSALRVAGVTSNTSITVGVPLGKTGVSTAACTLQPTDAGGLASIGVTDGPDYWSKHSTLAVWREDHSANLYPGSKYACGALKGAATREDLYQTVGAKDVDKFRGKNAVFGVGVKQLIKGGAGTWRAFISVDGTETFSTAATDTAYQWREIFAEVPTSATTIIFGVAFEGASADVYYVSQPMAGVGDYLGDWNYFQPRGELVQALKSVLVAPQQGATITFGEHPKNTPTALSDNTTTLGGNVGTDFAFRVRVNAECYGAIAANVREVYARFRARSAATSLARINCLTGIRVQCTTGGVRGSAVFRISANGGTNYSSNQTSGAGVGTMQWPAATYGPAGTNDTNNAFVQYQVINVGNGGSYTANDLWDFTTAGAKTFTGAGYDGITITTVTQRVTISARDRTGTPAPSESFFLESKVADATEAAVAWVNLEANGDIFLVATSMNTEWTQAYMDINGYVLS